MTRKGEGNLQAIYIYIYIFLQANNYKHNYALRENDAYMYITR